MADKNTSQDPRVQHCASSESFQSAVVQVAALYQKDAMQSNIAEMVRSVSESLASTGVSWKFAKQHFLSTVRQKHGTCYWQRLEEVLDQKLSDFELKLAKAEYSEEAVALQDEMDAPYLMQVMMSGEKMGIYYRLRFFHTDCLSEVHDLPPKGESQ